MAVRIFFSRLPPASIICAFDGNLTGGDLSRLVSFAHLSAEPGKVYYFRARFYGIEHLDLDPIDPDEGQYLVASSPRSMAQAKK